MDIKLPSYRRMIKGANCVFQSETDIAKTDATVNFHDEKQLILGIVSTFRAESTGWKRKCEDVSLHFYRDMWLI